ncbi:MAG TPA: LuxR C-terminal-related transcriptional regulator [Solirubrobacteraceae bacterium]
MPAATVSWIPISELSRRLGVSKDLLRKWERRYGVLEPARTATGHRLYSRVDQARAEYMLRHMRDGLPAAHAARLARMARFKEDQSTAAAMAQHAAVTATTTASFEDSLVPMLVADDRRRYVDVNRAASLLLRLSRSQLLALSIDDLSPRGTAGETERLWQQFIRDGTQSGTFELDVPGSGRLLVDYSAKAAVQPGRHLSLLVFPATGRTEPANRPAGGGRRLTQREREVITRVAMGERSAAIAHALGISVTTVESRVRGSLKKLGAHTRAHAIALALEAGEIDMQFPRSQ